MRLILAAFAVALCPEQGRRITCTVDGDTFWLVGMLEDWSLAELVAG